MLMFDDAKSDLIIDFMTTKHSIIIELVTKKHSTSDLVKDSTTGHF